MSFPVELRARYVRTTKMLIDAGKTFLNDKHTKSLGGGLYEIRLDADGNIARVTYCIEGKNIVLLSGFIKKTQKTPKPELERARNLLKQREQAKKAEMKKATKSVKNKSTKQPKRPGKKKR